MVGANGAWLELQTRQAGRLDDISAATDSIDVAA